MCFYTVRLNIHKTLTLKAQANYKLTTIQRNDWTR
uniref:Uncharacterized protein n=1 Tax=Anguilla anguilla TaxID=7936 RepID=A0A0E9TEU9_ANGAN